MIADDHDSNIRFFGGFHGSVVFIGGGVPNSDCRAYFTLDTVERRN
jgi:hypothetical protein